MGHSMHAALQVGPAPHWQEQGGLIMARLLSCAPLPSQLSLPGERPSWYWCWYWYCWRWSLVNFGQYHPVGGGNDTTHRVCINHIYGSATILGDLPFLFPSATSIGARTGAGGPRTRGGKRGRGWHVSLHQGLCGGSSPGKSVR